MKILTFITGQSEKQSIGTASVITVRYIQIIVNIAVCLRVQDIVEKKSAVFSLRFWYPAAVNSIPANNKISITLFLIDIHLIKQYSPRILSGEAMYMNKF